MYYQKQPNSGFSLIDVIIGISLMLIAFLGIYGMLRLSIILIATTKASTGALALATEQLEFIRSLPYDDVGTISGVPAGNIPQSETVTLNGRDYTRRTVILYEDAPQDGLGVLDTNSITADYKVAKVEMSWDIKGNTRSLMLVTNVVPPGIETLAGGGTLTINVIDALAGPVLNADVQIVNNTTSPTIDVTLLSNANGVVNLPGAPAASEYEVYVSKTDFSSARTYPATPTLPNPNPGHLSVVAGDTTSITFAIDELAQKTIRTFEPVATTTFTDTFVSGANLSTTSSNIQVLGGQLQILDPGSGYSLATATAQSIEIDPVSIVQWNEFRFNYSEPASTTVLLYLFDGSTTPELVPDVDLPGNSAGLTVSPVDLSSLSTTTYPELIIGVDLKTDDDTVTPAVLDWDLEYMDGPVPLPNVDFNMQGAKTIGTDGGAQPVYKFSEDMQTDAWGTITTTTVEWDTYDITVDGGATGLDISAICDPQPRTINPNEPVTTDITLVTDTSHTLLVTVRDNTDALINNASVRLHRSGFDQTQVTSGCGQTFFSNVPEGTVGGGNAYNLDTSAAGYTTDNQTDVEVSGVSTNELVLFP